MEVGFLGNYFGHGPSFDGSVFDYNMLSPTLLASNAHGNAPKFIEIRKVDIVNEQNTIPSRAEQSRAEQHNCTKFIGSLNNHGHGFAGAIFDSDYLAPTLTTMQGGGREPHIVEVKKMEKINVLGGLTENSSQRNVVYDDNGISPAMQAAFGEGGGNKPLIIEQQIVAMRGRDKENPNHRGPANENYEQVLEINNSGISNTLTSVTKDNLVLETKYYGVDEQNQCIRKETFGTLTTDGSSPKHNNRVAEIKKLEQDLIVDDLYENREKRVYENVSPTLRGERNGLKTIKIRQATKEGFIDCEIPGVADLDYPNSNTRRGRVQMGGQISPTLTTENIPSVIELGDPDFYNFLYEIDGEIYLIRIRKLIPKECLALMDVDEEYINRMLEVESNTNLYKAAGNSIVVNCLTAIFGMMFEGKEDVYKEEYGGNK